MINIYCKTFFYVENDSFRDYKKERLTQKICMKVILDSGVSVEDY